MTSVLVPWFAACSLLAVAGVAKLRSPGATQGALRAARLPSSRVAVLALGAAEVAVGLGGLTGNRVAAALVAVAYLGFTAFVVGALRRGGTVQSCGCFGSPDVPATSAHLAVDLAAAGVAAAVALRGVPSLGAVVGEGGTGYAVVLLAVAATAQGLLLLTTFARLQGERAAIRGSFGW